MNRNRIEPPFVVALDVGSSSIRASVFDAAGQAVPGLHSVLEHRVHSTPDGGAELDPDGVVTGVVHCLARLADRPAFRRCRPRVLGVSCSMFMHTLVGANAGERAITPLYMWSDTRSRSALARAARPLDAEAVHQRTGCPLHTSYPLAKLIWLRRSAPRLFRRCRFWLSMGDYLHLRLLGRRTLSYSMASGSGLLAFRKLQWDAPMLAAAGVEPGQLGELADFDHRSLGLRPEFRRTLEAFAEVPWFPAMADGACSNLGSGCVDARQFALNLGTSAAMRVIDARRSGRVPDGLLILLQNPLFRRWIRCRRDLKSWRCIARAHSLVRSFLFLLVFASFRCCFLRFPDP